MHQRQRPDTDTPLSMGRIQLLGFMLRGQGMFSHVGLPISAETLEYAWLMEITLGQITGQLTAPQLATVAHCVNDFVFGVTDPENRLVPSHSFELCQHAYPQVIP